MDWEGFRRRKQSWASWGTVLSFAWSDWENYDKKFGWSLSRTRFKPVTFRVPIRSSASCELVLNVLKRIRFENVTLTDERPIGNVGILGFAYFGDLAVSGLSLQLLGGWDRGFESIRGIDVRLFVVCCVGSGL